MNPAPLSPGASFRFLFAVKRQRLPGSRRTVKQLCFFPECFLSIKHVFCLRFDTNIRDARFPGCFVSVEVSHISSPLLRPSRVVFTGSASVWMADFLLLLRAHRGMWLWIMSMVTSNLIDFKDFRVYKSVIGELISQTLTVKSSLGLLLQGLSFQSWIDLFGW